MSENIGKLTRREALGTFGTVLAASAVVGLASKNVQAQVQSLNFTVEKYQIHFRSAAQYSFDSFIFLYDTSYTKNVAVYFMKEGQTIPVNTVADDLQTAKVYFGRNMFQEVCNFLRHEKPVRITVVKTNGIATLYNEGYELVGDLDIN